ncbi:hypothetical protein ACTA71_011044 [Dictyostelium dimigraforme]
MEDRNGGSDVSSSIDMWQSTNVDISIDQSINRELEKVDLSDDVRRGEMKVENFENGGDGNNNNDNNINKVGDGEGPSGKIKKIIFSIKMYIIQYFKKWLGTGKDKRPPIPDLEEIGWTWLASFIGILVLALIHYREAIDAQMQVLIGSFAASAVIIFGVPKSPLAQPRNLILGHFLSAIVGSVIRVALVYTKANFEVACALAVSLSITIMQFTNSLHPPGGATALICVMGVEQRWRGFYFIFVPITSGAFIMLLTALIVNNFARKRSYPLYWWLFKNHINLSPVFHKNSNSGSLLNQILSSTIKQNRPPSVMISTLLFQPQLTNNAP